MTSLHSQLKSAQKNTQDTIDMFLRMEIYAEDGEKSSEFATSFSALGIEIDLKLG